jgi:VWFA-related protein
MALRQRRRPLRPVTAGLVYVMAAGAIVLAQNSRPAPTPPQRPVFRAGAMLVPIDVRVLDAEGKPVTDLTAADFTVLEDLQAQEIAHFWTQDLAAARTASPMTRVARQPDSRTVRPQSRRIFLIVLGRGRLQPPAQGVDGVIHLVRERLLPHDYVAVIAWNRATDFTTDHARVAGVLERFRKAHEGIEALLLQRFSGLTAAYGGRQIGPVTQKLIDAVFDEAGAPARTIAGTDAPDQARMGRDARQVTGGPVRLVIGAAHTGPNIINRIDAPGFGTMSFDDYVETRVQAKQDLTRLYSGINYLSQVDGEKRLLFLSERGVLLSSADDDHSLAARASDARVVIDIIHTGGVPLIVGRGGREAPVLPDWDSMWQVAMARTVTEHIGGHFTGTMRASKAIDAIDRASRFQYLLSYYTSNTTLDGRYRRVLVRVNRPGLTVHYRHGYYARP